MGNDDIFDMLDNGETISAKPEKEVKPSYQNNKERTNYNPNWNNTNISPATLKRENMVTDGKAFTLVTSYRTEQLPEEAKNKIEKVMSYLASKGLTYRNMTAGSDEFGKELMNKFENKETYLPWRNFNKEIKAPAIFQPSELSYRVAVNYHKSYLKLPDIVRTLLACKMHTVLGKNCNEPVKFILAWSECGSESFKKDMDWKKLGDLSMFIKIAKDLAIPFININSSSFSADKLNSLIG